MFLKNKKIIITGAAGLVGQNLVLYLRESGYENIVALDKNKENLDILKKINPSVCTVLADLSEPGGWEVFFEGAYAIILLHAQITGLDEESFIKNNVIATQNVLEVIKQYNVSYVIHISSSVVNSKARDLYTTTKIQQEQIVCQSGVNYCVLRPTLMFGWFDPKHLGWLSRLMEKIPCFPIPGNGQYVRQPLYSRDFCKIITSVLEKKPRENVYDIVGQEKITYIDIIRTIKKSKKIKTLLVRIPYRLFYVLLKIYAFFDKKPPFTADQLKALTAGDYFVGVDTEKVFDVPMTALNQAIHETFTHPIYSKVVLKR